MKTQILSVILLLTALQIKAQPNVALTAAVSHSGGGTAGTPDYTAKNYNDNYIVSCTTTCAACTETPYGWTNAGSTNWIEYRWASPQTFDKVIFYKSTQALRKTTLQYWNGSTYVNIAAYNSAKCPVDSISFPPVTSTRLRFYGMDAGSISIWFWTFLLAPMFREIQVFEHIPPCSGAPAAGTIAGSYPAGTPVCRGTLVSLSVTGAATSLKKDIKYQWQRRRMALFPGNWADISGATEFVYKSDTLTGWEYRFAAICTTTKDTGYTVSHSVPQASEPEVSISPAGPISVCEGDTAWLTASNHTGGVYTWMRDGIPVYGWKFSDFGARETGNYTVKVETADPCPGYSQAVSVVRTDPGFSADLSVGSDSILCEGETVTLFGSCSKPGVNYQWLKDNIPVPGATGPSYLVNTGGYYKVVAADGSGCPAGSRNIFFVVHPKPEATIFVPGEALTACEGKGVLLVSSPAYEYQWSLNGNPVVGWNEDSLLVKNSGRYTVKIRSSEGCVNTSAVVSVSILPAPAPVISKTGLQLTTDPGFANYTWTRNGTEVAASGPGELTLALVRKGLYRVSVIDENGCEGISDPIEVWDDALSVGNFAAAGHDISIYPNPARDKVFIKAQQTVNVKVEEISGRFVYSGEHVTEVSLDGYADGLYLITIYDQQGNIIKKEKISKIRP